MKMEGSSTMPWGATKDQKARAEGVWLTPAAMAPRISPLTTSA